VWKAELIAGMKLTPSMAGKKNAQQKRIAAVEKKAKVGAGRGCHAADA
jgi:hypothetical protein